MPLSSSDDEWTEKDDWSCAILQGVPSLYPGILDGMSTVLVVTCSSLRKSDSLLLRVISKSSF
jgi:hypothetical protein